MLKISINLFLLFCLNLYGVIKVDKDTKYKEILSLSQIYIDDTMSLSLDEVKKKEFIDNDKHILSYGYSPHIVLWIRFTVDNNSKKAIEKIVQYDHTVTNDLRFYDGDKVYQDGIFKFKEKRTVLTPYFSIALNPNESKTYYIRVDSQTNPLNIKLNLWDVKEFYFAQIERQFFLALFFGAMGVLFIYNFFIFLSTRNISYLWYVLYIFSVTLHLFAFNGLIYKFEIDFLYDFYKVYMITFPITIVVVALMTKSFLNIKQYPRINNILNIYLVVTFIFFILNFFTDVLEYSRLSEVSFMTYIFFIVCYSAYKKNRQAYFLLVGWLILLLSLLFFFLVGTGIISTENVFPYFSEVGVLCEAIIFSFALADRIKILQREKQLVNEKLIFQQKNEEKKLKKEVESKTKDLSLALDEKEVLLKELHHRVKNNMQMVVSLLRLQSRDINDKRLKDIFKQAQNRINAMSHLHELLYRQDSFTHIDSQEYFSYLIIEIKSASKIDVDINYNLEVDLKIEEAIYCGLIINELVSNSFKYAFVGIANPKININLRKYDSKYELIILDNGIGFDKDKKIESLGLTLVESLASIQLKGDIDMDTSKGTKVRITWS